MHADVTHTRETKKHERTCAGCGKADDLDAMVRLVLGPDGAVAVDSAGGAFGRGAHVHARPDCIAKACKGGLARSFKGKVACDAKALADAIVEAGERRIAGLLIGARRAGHLAVGADAACEALDAGAPLVLVATDAATVTGKSQIARAIAEGRALAWSNKAELGGLLGREEVAIVAVRDAGIARQMLLVGSRCFACRSEDR